MWKIVKLKKKKDEKDLIARGIEEKLETQKKYQKKLEDQRIIEMFKKNYIFNTVKDCQTQNFFWERGTIRCQIFQWFPMIFNVNAEEGEIFFFGWA